MFYDGIGWAPSDPTPPDLQAGGTDLRTRASARLRSLLGLVDRLPGGRRTAAVALLALAAAGGLLLRRRRRRPAPAPPRAPATGGAPGPVLTAFLRLDARLGPRGRRPSESLSEMRDRLGLPPEAVAAVEQECYGAVPPQAAQAVEVLDRL